MNNNEDTKTETKDQGTKTETKKREPQIGGINQQRNQYTTIGGGQRPPDQSTNAQAPRNRNAQEPEHPGVETFKRQGTQEPERSGVEAPTKRERHTIYLPPDLSEWIKIHAIKAKCEISEVATEAIQRYKNEIENR